MPKETKQTPEPGDRVRVIRIREGLYHQLGETAIVLSSKEKRSFREELWIRVRWDYGHPKEQNCWADQFEIVTKIKVMEDTREYLEAITEGSSNG